MKHFLDTHWLAPNVMRVAIDPAIPVCFADLAAGDLPPSYHAEKPDWSSDIRWISAAEETAFARFQAAFDALDAARHVVDYVAVDRAIRLYQGFVVVRSECREANFHVDWENAGNQAFTFLGTGAFTGVAGQLRYEQVSGNTFISGDTNGDGVADFMIRVDGVHSLGSDDFIL